MKPKVSKEVVTKSQQARWDALVDLATGRGTRTDPTQRTIGVYRSYQSDELRGIYKASGFAQTIIDEPAEDCVREGFEIEVNLDQQKNTSIARMLENDWNKYNFNEHLTNLIRYSGIYAQGSIMYFGFKTDNPRQMTALDEPLDKTGIKDIEFVNTVFDDSGLTIVVYNSFDMTLPDYGKPYFYLMGRLTDPSRMVWLCNNFDPREREGISILARCIDVIRAQDSALWSASSQLSVLYSAQSNQQTLDQSSVWLPCLQGTWHGSKHPLTQR